MRASSALLLVVAGAVLAALPVQAAPPQEISYQGLVTDGGGNPLTGPVDMSFRIYDAPAPGGTLLWSEYQSTVTLTNGVFDVMLGSEAPLDISFDGPRYLETRIDENIIGTRRLLGASPYSLGVGDGAAVRSLNGLRDDLRIVGGTNVTVSEAGDSITIAAAGGSVGADNDWLVSGSNMSSIPSGSVGIGTATPSGKLHLFSQNAFGTTMFVEDAGTSGFALSSLALTAGAIEARLQVIDNGVVKNVLLQTMDPLMGLNFFAHADIIFATDGKSRLRLASTGQAEFLRVAGGPGVVIRPASGQDGGGYLEINNDADQSTVEIGTNSQGGGSLELNGGGSAGRIVMTGNNQNLPNGGGEILVKDGSGFNRVQLEGAEAGSTTDGGQVTIYNDANLATMVLDGDLGDTDGGSIEMFAANGNKTVEIRAQESVDAANGASLKLFDDTGALTIELDADYGASGEGRIITETIEITGGADLSEQFNVASGDIAMEPGMIAVIDPERPGGLRLSERAYDPRVAGVISGAGGVKPGMLMGQHGTEADGEVPVALTGRVYCWVDASNGAIAPGDLLTTSDTPGHAMRVDDPSRAHGTILGKAMTPLAKGRGLVLVLVALQ
jgi:hypothetical protein